MQRGVTEGKVITPQNGIPQRKPPWTLRVPFLKAALWGTGPPGGGLPLSSQQLWT